MGLSVDLSATNLVVFGFLYFCAKKAWGIYQAWKVQQMLEKWDNSPKGKAILHGVQRCKTIPSISPYCIKLETYLREAEIPYEFESENPFGPKGKSPWVSYNGTHVADSQLVIQFLNKKFGVDLNKHLTPDQREICRALRIMLENHFAFGMGSWRWVQNLSSINQLIHLPFWTRALIGGVQSCKVQKALKAQGLGLHSLPELTEMTCADLKTVSVILGNKKFFGGEAPCEEDCAIFGMLGQVLWAAPGSPYEKLVDDELSNLKGYCERMKERVWPDFEQLLDRH